MDKELLKRYAIELEKEFELCAPFEDLSTKILHNSFKQWINGAQKGLIEEPSEPVDSSWYTVRSDPSIPPERYESLMDAVANFNVILSGQKIHSDKINKPVAKKYADILLDSFVNHEAFSNFADNSKFIELLNKVSQGKLEDAFWIQSMFDEAFNNFSYHPPELVSALVGLTMALDGSQDIT